MPAHEFPAIIFSSLAISSLEVDFFPVILAHIGDVKISRLAIEGHLHGVTHLVSPDFRPGIEVNLRKTFFRDAKEHHLLQGCDHGVVCRNPVATVAAAGIDINTKHLGQEGAEILPRANDIPFPSTISTTDVKVSVRPENQFTPIVVGIRLLDLHHYTDRIEVRSVGIIRRGAWYSTMKESPLNHMSE